MGPEQASSAKDLTPAADVYSLGAVLVFALTGHYPYARPTLPALLFANTDRPHTPTRGARTTLRPRRARHLGGHHA